MSKFSPNTLHLENSEEAAIVVTTAHHYYAASSGHEECGAPDRRPSSQVSASQLRAANHWNVSRNVSYRVHCIVYRIVSWARLIVSVLVNIWSGYLLTHCHLVMPCGDTDLFSIGSGNGLLPDGNKPLPEPMMISPYWGSLAHFVITATSPRANELT